MQVHTNAVVNAARVGEHTAERDALYTCYHTELLPHTAAEEHTLYRAASELAITDLLIRGMVAEHRYLEELVAELALAREPIEIAIIAASARTLFEAHLAKENDLLLPALDQAGFDLSAMLAGMHAILGH